MITRATRTRTTGGLRPALLAAVVVSVILGIVGMHALSTHGLMGGTSDAAMDMTSAATTMASSAHMSGHHDGAANVDRAAGAAVSTAHSVASFVSGGDTGHGMGDMVMLCVAMIALGAGTLLLALLALRRAPRLWAHLPNPQAALFTPFTVHRGAGPPPVWEFSVIRC